MIMKTALIQYSPGTDKEDNLNRIEYLIEDSVRKGANLIILPESTTCPYSTEYFSDFAEKIPDGETSNVLSSLAKKYGIFIIGGSIPEKFDNKLYNSSPIFSSAGGLIGVHRKIHLFDVDLDTVDIKESDVFSAGHELTVFSTPFAKIGVLVCYDIRFPELFRLLVDSGVDMVVVPAAFSVETGEAHWKELIKIRAVDNQIFVAAVSPARNQKHSYKAYGYSRVVDPFGNTLASAKENEETIIVELDFDLIQNIRDKFPLLKHRRSDLYKVVDNSK